MIPRRVLVNLAAFVALFAAAVHLGGRQRDPPRRASSGRGALTAEFEGAPGLRPNVEVTYLGVRVGTIRSLDLREGAVVVEMEIDRDQDLPEGADRRDPPEVRRGRALRRARAAQGLRAGRPDDRPRQRTTSSRWR